MTAAEFEKSEGLKRKVKVTVPTERVQSAFDSRIKHHKKQAKIPGFRPGKAPDDIVAKHCRQVIEQEVANQLVNQSFPEILAEHKLRVAGSPNIELMVLKQNEPMQYVANFEVYPEFELKDLAGCEFEKIAAEITAKDIDAMIEKLRQQQAQWQTVERAVQAGDQVVIDFVGKLDGETFEGGSAQDFKFVVGSKQMLPDFEQGVLEMQPNQQKEINVTFPKDYPAENLAGQTAVFSITLKNVQAPQLPEVDDAFAKKMGVESGVENLKEEVKRSMQREIESAATAKLKQDVFDKLLEVNPITPPDSLIETEIAQLQEMTRKQMVAYRQVSEQNAAKINLPKENYLPQAKRRVVLGLLLSEVIKKHELKADKDKIRTKVEELAKGYQQPEQVLAWYYNNKQALAEVEAAVLEEEALTKLLETAKVVDKKVDYQQAIELSGDGSKT